MLIFQSPSIIMYSASIDISIENQMYLKTKRNKICSSLSRLVETPFKRFVASSLRDLFNIPRGIKAKKELSCINRGMVVRILWKIEGEGEKIKEGTVGSQAWQSFTDANSIGKIRRGRNVSKGRRRRRLAAWNFYFSSDARPFIWLNSTWYAPRFRPNFTDLPGGNRSGTRNKRGEQRRQRRSIVLDTLLSRSTSRLRGKML